MNQFHKVFVLDISNRSTQITGIDSQIAVLRFFDMGTLATQRHSSTRTRMVLFSLSYFATALRRLSRRRLPLTLTLVLDHHHHNLCYCLLPRRRRRSCSARSATKLIIKEPLAPLAASSSVLPSLARSLVSSSLLSSSSQSHFESGKGCLDTSRFTTTTTSLTTVRVTSTQPSLCLSPGPTTSSRMRQESQAACAAVTHPSQSVVNRRHGTCWRHRHRRTWYARCDA